MQELQKDTVSQWDGPGWRIFTYAIKLILPPSVWGKDGEYKIFLDPYVLQKIAGRRERLLAFWLMGSLMLLMLYGVYYVRES
ncbi:hypothetical protein [Alkalimonas sp.]|uniref:hypothetical protein n=1 Tax=Alkalimonas sp. TaxID=1872453 RepID=UPI00263BBA48|nr:hypothetical protein [Alkalimonas sp.]MCC5827460.1 hypothetical protein [Alkalimonas sp.]